MSFASLIENLVSIIPQAANDWGSTHPFIVHFPIGFMFIAPLFIVLGMICQRSAKPFFICALLLMLIGTLTIFLAVSSGNHAAEHLQLAPDAVSTLEHHLNLAEDARFSFSVLSALFFLFVVFQSQLEQKFNRSTTTAILALFLLIYLFSLALLLNAAHYGGKLVHRHGVTSKLYSGTK